MLPLSIDIENFLSHTKSVIDFSKFNIALILGSYYGEFDKSNGSGKSSIFSAIEWALFDKSRHKRKDGVVKQDKRSCCVKYVFSVDDIAYKIVRARDKVVGETDVKLYQLDGKKEVSISCDTNTATNNKIIKIIGVDHNIFINSVYFKQNDISMFANTTSYKRKDILRSFLKMDKWSEYHKSASNNVKRLSTIIDEKSKQLLSIKDLNQDLDKSNNDIASIKGGIEKYEKEYVDVRNRLIDMQVKYKDLYENTSTNTLSNLRKEYEVTKDTISNIQDKIIFNDTKVKKYSFILDTMSKESKSLSKTIKTAENINLDVISKKIVFGKTKKSALDDRIKRIKSDLCMTDKCNVCDTPLTIQQVQEIKNKLSGELKECEANRKNIIDKLKRADDIFNKKTEMVNNANKSALNKNKLDIKILKLKNEIEKHIDDNKRLSEQLKRLTSRNFDKEIKILENRLDHHKKEAMHKEIKAINDKTDKIKGILDKLNIEYGSKKRKCKELVQVIESQEEMVAEINKLKENYAVYNKLKDCFGKDGVQAIIIENVIEELETYTNDLLAKICNEPTSILIKTQKQNDSGRWMETLDIIVKSGTRSDEFETFSGGEQFRISLALRMALSTILSKRMGGSLKLLLLDEVSSNLDNKGLEMFMTTIKEIGNDIKVLVITHNEKLKEQFDDIIIVDKESGGSIAKLQ